MNSLRDSIKELEEKKLNLIQKINELKIEIQSTKDNSIENEFIEDSFEILKSSFLDLRLEREKKLEELVKSNNSKRLIIDQFVEEFDQHKRNIFELEEL